MFAESSGFGEQGLSIKDRFVVSSSVNKQDSNIHKVPATLFGGISFASESDHPVCFSFKHSFANQIVPS
jgi:hypothetical protein